MHQLVNRRRLRVDHSLDGLNDGSEQALLTDGVCRSLGRHFDHSDTRIIGAAIVSSVAQVTEPDFKFWRVEFVNLLLVGDDGGFAADRSPFACAVEEAEIDIGAVFEVVGFAAVVVGVEDVIDIVVFLAVNVLVHL